MVLRRALTAALLLLAGCATPPPPPTVTPERLEDAVRYQLINKHPTEAWRLLELARRLNVPVAGADYYRALASLQSSVCTINLPAEPRAWRLLLEAYMYRYPTRFQQGTYRASPYDDAAYGKLEHHLDPLQTHYLADIPSIALLPGTGCRWYKKRFADRKTAGDYELAALKIWRELSPTEPTTSGAQVTGHDAVELRLVELAVQRKDLDLAREILTPYAGYDAARWALTPEPERRFVWQMLIGQGLEPPPPYAPGTPQDKLIRALILQLHEPDAAYWLGLLTPPDLATPAEKPLADHLASIEELPHHPYLLAKAADAAYRRGDAAQCLALVRRLLLLDEAESDSEVEAFAANLATRIFAEYHYDEALLGAVQSSLPAGDWSRIFRRLLMQQALLGDQSGFNATLHSVSSPAAARMLRLDKDETAFLSSLATRQGAAFGRSLAAWGRAQQTTGRVISLLGELGEVVLQLTPTERATVQPYLQQISLFLRQRINDGSPSQRRLVELMQLYGQGSHDAFARGSETARDATVTAGVVDLSQGTKLTYPFTWSAPTHLPLRELLELPVGVHERTWELR